jgi:hypothetical protein
VITIISLCDYCHLVTWLLSNCYVITVISLRDYYHLDTWLVSSRYVITVSLRDYCHLVTWLLNDYCHLVTWLLSYRYVISVISLHDYCLFTWLLSLYVITVISLREAASLGKCPRLLKLRVPSKRRKPLTQPLSVTVLICVPQFAEQLHALTDRSALFRQR